MIGVITARVAKRAKVMFSQACVTSTQEGWAIPKVYHLPPSSWTTPPSPPPPRSDQVTTPPPLARVKGHNTSSLPPPPPTLARVKGHNTSLPPPGTMRRSAVRILLECILVCYMYLNRDNKHLDQMFCNT